MITAVIIFACITALLELVLLLKFASVPTMNKSWFKVLVHVGVALLNLLVHWGTLVGTMTAITAALVSFMTLPLAIYLKIVWTRYKKEGLRKALA
jgi:hypothetical protein